MLRPAEALIASPGERPAKTVAMKPILFLAALAPVLGACIPATPPYLVAPADPAISGRTPRYSAVTAGVKGYAPVGPGDWREMNREVAPRSGQPTTEGARRGR